MYLFAEEQEAMSLPGDQAHANLDGSRTDRACMLTRIKLVYRQLIRNRRELAVPSNRVSRLVRLWETTGVLLPERAGSWRLWPNAGVGAASL
jgi:hypothetical protein